jgi:hypothetical protein
VAQRPGDFGRADHLQALGVHQVEVADQVGRRDDVFGGADGPRHAGR